MKKLITITLLFFSLLVPAIAVAAPAQESKTISPAALRATINECSHIPEVDLVKIGGLGMSIAKGVMKLAVESEGDDEDIEAYKTIKGIRSLVVMDYSDCNSENRAKINRKLDKLFSNSEVLMEMKDDGETVQIYGVLSEDGKEIHDFVLYTPSEYSVVGIFGKISLEHIAEIAEEY